MGSINPLPKWGNYLKYFAMKIATLLKTIGIYLFLQILILNYGFCQDIIVKGHVTDVFNRILMGVSVKSAENKNEVFTDSTGFYQIITSTKGKLVFSGPSLASQKVSIKGKNTLDVSLSFDLSNAGKSSGNDSVKSQRNQSTTVNQKLIQQNKELGIDQLLKSIAGVQVVYQGPEMKVLIHGIKSLHANNFALIVLNGFVFNGMLSDLNRNDIESLEVLKDPAALAAWGSQGANGVVLISTKQTK
jgi:TonB-dependent SusC/RagA subfamily outer membrane receptor